MSRIGEDDTAPLLSPLPPPRPVLREVPRRGPPKDWEELARGYADVAAADHQHLRAIYGELDQHRGAVNVLGSMIRAQGPMLRQAVVESVRETIATEREQLRAEMQREVADAAGRQKMPSASEIAAELAEDLVEEIRTNPGLHVPEGLRPPAMPQRDSERMRAMARQELDARDLEKYRKTDAENRKLRMGIIGTVAAAIILSVLTFLAGHAHGASSAPPAVAAPAH